MFSCPCCGYLTLPSRNEYEICPICWWEDDGQDNADADKVFGGPNYDLSLTQARANFIIFGIYDPNRTDLVPESKSNFEKSRIFDFIRDGSYLIEKNTNWVSSNFFIKR